MDTRRLLVIVLSFIAAVCRVNGEWRGRRDTRSTEVTAWTGQELSLTCGDDMQDTVRRFWRKDLDILAVASFVISSDPRVNVVNNSVELRVANVTADDEGEYVCTVNKRPKYRHAFLVRVRELVCETPTAPRNGRVDNDTSNHAEGGSGDDSSGAEGGVGGGEGDAAGYRYGDTVRYSCDAGFQLTGSPTRVCSDPYKGWIPEVPTCEPEFLASIKRRLDDMEKLYLSGTLEGRAVGLLQEKVTGIETRVTSLEGGNGVSGSGSIDSVTGPGVGASLERLRAAVNANIHRSRWEKLLHGDLASLGDRDGYLVSEFTWFVDKFEEKVAQHRAEKFPYLESKPFYTHVPGYRFQLHLYPDYDSTGHMGVYAVLVPGEFDSMLAWPFTNRYEISVVSRQESESLYDVLIPRDVPTCGFDRPPPDNTIGCGFGKFASLTTVLAKKDQYLFDSGIVLKLMVYLNYK